MRNSVFSLIVGVLIATKGISCNDDVFAVKCCDLDEQLDADLKSCQKSGDTTVAHTTDLSNYSETTESSMYTIATGTTLVMHENANFTEHNWLPAQLRSNLGKDNVLFGRMNNCSNRRTVRLQTPRDTKRLTWLSNGSLMLNSYTALGKFQNHIFEPIEFCIDTFTDTNTTEQQHAILLCPCARIPCLRKCCPVGEAITCGKISCECNPHDSVWQPFYQDLPTSSHDFPYEIVADDYLDCGEDYDSLVYIFDGYPLYLLHRFWRAMLKDGKICGDMVADEKQTARHGMMKCSPELPFPNVYVLVNWLHVPEAILLAVTLIVTLMVHRRRLSAYSYVHDLSLLWHVVALFARCLLWSVYLKAKWSCSLLPIFIYFFSMAASFWLNVLCLNMAFGFWKPLGVQHSRWGRSKEMFLLYSLYAWCASSAMTGFTAAMWYSREVPQGLLRPTLHETRTCFREEEGDGKIATFAYYYGPVAALLCVNAILFSSTALRVRELRQNSAMLSNSASTSRSSSFSNKRSVMIYIKLLWMMGVTEMAVEGVAWISNSNEYYFALAGSCLDVIRAAAIFFLSCCKRRTMLALLRRFRACAARCSSRWCCRQRAKAETNLKDVGVRYSKDPSDISMTTEVTVTDSEVVSNVE